MGSAEGVAQIFVDQIEVKPIWVEMPACPAKMRLVVVMVGVADGFEKISIGPGAADILRRSSAGSLQAFGMTGQGIEGQPFRDPDHVGPVVAEIVEIAEGQFLPCEIRQPDFGVVEDPHAAKAIVKLVEVAIAQAADPELMQMAVGPAERGLKHEMKRFREIWAKVGDA